MLFFGFGAPAAAPEPEEKVIPGEEELLQALRIAYRNPNITTTKAMHLVWRPPRVCCSLIPIQIVLTPARETADPTAVHASGRLGTLSDLDGQPEAGPEAAVQGRVPARGRAGRRRKVGAEHVDRGGGRGLVHHYHAGHCCASCRAKGVD